MFDFCRFVCHLSDWLGCVACGAAVCYHTHFDSKLPGQTHQYYQLTGPFIWAMQSFLHM